MKVLQINALSGRGSTGRICQELSESLIGRGHEGFIAYSQGLSYFSNSFRFGNTLEQKTHALLSRITGLQGYFSPIGTKDLVSWIEYEKPDIVHLHNLHSNNISLIKLLNFLADSKMATAITLHDCWYFTGKCTHYTDENCKKWESHCYECPRIRKDNKSYYFDRTYKMFEDKNIAFDKIDNLAVIGVSDWITNEAKRSILKKAKIIERVYNWIDQSKFKPVHGEIRLRLGISKGQSIVLAVSSGWDYRSNKFNKVIKLAGLLPENIKVLLVGSLRYNESLPYGIIHIPYVESMDEMAEIYSLADIYVHFSTEDTFGKVIAEAMACGTPVIVYDSTACPEVVGDGCGLIVDRRDIGGLYSAVMKIISESKSKYSDNCIQHVTENFNFNEQVNKTIHIYEKLLQQ